MFGHKLKPAWRYAARGILWRIVPTPSGKLVGEERDPEKKRAAFFCVDQKTGDVAWENVTFDEAWWIGIEGVHKTTLLLHKFATPDLPEHLSIIAIDIPTGRTLWQNDELKFEGGEGESVFASRRMPDGTRKYIKLQLSSGNIQNEITPDEIRVAIPVSTDDEPEEIPRIIVDVNSESSSAANILRRHINLERVVGPVEYIERPSCVVGSHYERSPLQHTDRLRAFIKVVDRESDTLLFDTVILNDASSPTPGNLFMKDGFLFFIHERKNLTALLLPVEN